MAKQKPSTNQAPGPPPEYTVVARRYRPQQFADLVGQEAVARALTNAIKTDRVAHAYLFTGARGTGKTSTARILAKALNCVKGPTPTPCDQCEICLSIASGEDIDVLEIDGASNRGIDEVRAIRQNVSTRPSRARYKIYTIDEVHMLTPPAFNALLKTLEEPPPHVKFIFATTEVQKIPITILSRCQRFDFSGIPSAKIASRLKEVVAAEGMQADDDALTLVARRAGGSMRDAQSLLDQLLAFGSERLTAAKVHQLLGTASDDRILALADAVAAKDAKAAFEMLSRCAEEGLQLGELLDQLIEYWRNLMLLQCGGKEMADVAMSEASRDRAAAHAQSMPLDTILAGLDILTTAKARLRGSNHGLVLLEMAVLRLVRLDELVPVAQLAQWLSQPGSHPVQTAPAVNSTSSKPAAAADPAKKKSTAVAETVSNGQGMAGNATMEGDWGTTWEKVCENVGPMLAGNLRAAGLPAILGPKSLVLRFSSGYTSQYDYCSEAASIERIQNALRTCTGQDWIVRTEVAANAEAGRSVVRSQVVTAKNVTSREREQGVLQIPLLSRAVEKLGARLLKMDDGFGTGEAAGVEGESTDAQEP